MDIIANALKQGRKTLSEFEAKKILAARGIPVTREVLIHQRKELFDATETIGFPLVMKACSPDLPHKSEKGLIATDIRSVQEAAQIFYDLAEAMGDQPAVLIQEMVRGGRELAMGLIRDPQFGPTVMFGLGGVLAELIDDVTFRVAPLEEKDALAMMDEIKSKKILGNFRGMQTADRGQLGRILIALGQLGLDTPAIKEIDINPVIVADGKGVAADALIVLE